MKELFAQFKQNGVVQWLGVRRKRKEPMSIIDQVHFMEDVGIDGDRYKSNGVRQVTIIQREHLDAVASFLSIESLDPSLVRRNVVVEGINLLALKGKRFTMGEAILEYTGECHPCSRMEEALGVGGYNAMRGHGGITARIIKSGRVKIGDGVSVTGD
ncbi:MOSC domain-containing protein [Pseudochryseolinea flava]|nr:MOSC domain-containing protein [Pseudochryseolinea flava]